MRAAVSVRVLLIAAIALTACGEREPTGPFGPYDITFLGPPQLGLTHAGAAIRFAAVGVRETFLGPDSVVLFETRVVEGSDPSFEVKLRGLRALSSLYEWQAFYWIDTGSGAVPNRLCDGPTVDPQARTDIGILTDHGAIALDAPGSPACEPFLVGRIVNGVGWGWSQLSGWMVEGIVRHQDGAAVARTSTPNTPPQRPNPPAVEFEIPPVLIRGERYRFFFYVDNPEEGVPGACDDPSIDPQSSAGFVPAESDDSGLLLLTIELPNRYYHPPSICHAFDM